MQEQDDLPAVRKTISAHAGCKEAAQQLENLELVENAEAGR